MRFNKARPPGELRHKAVRGLFQRNIKIFRAILSAISPLRHGEPCHLSPSERLCEFAFQTITPLNPNLPIKWQAEATQQID
jgi:hypothetical protein